MTTPAIVSKAGALLAVGSAVLHTIALGAHSWGVATVMVVMIAGCLYCAYELWSLDTVRSWVLVAVMNLVMIGAHLPMAGGHHHSGLSLAPAAASSAMQWATAVAVCESILAVAVLLIRTRARRCDAVPQLTP